MLRHPALSFTSFFIASIASASSLCAQCQTDKLTGEPLEGFAQFGRSVAISGNRIVVGSVNQDAGGHDSGAAYVYELAGGAWSLQATLVANDGADFDEFGVTVAIDDDTILVGADAVDGPLSGAVGAAYFFHWNGSQWSQTQRVQASDGADGGFFGCAVALEGDTAVIGRFWDSAGGAPHAGSAYVFRRNAGTWSQTQKLVGSNPHEEDQFGYALAMSGDRIVVGAPERFTDDDATDLQLGQVYVFERNGATWAESARLVASNPQQYDQFGISVDIDGDELVVGAWQELFSDQFGGDGEAYVFDWNGSTWNETQILIGSDPHHNDEYGGAVSIQGSTLVVGAASHDAFPLWGAVYAYAKDVSGWSETALFLPQANSSLSWLGNSVALGGNYVAAGAFIETFGVYQSGTAYVFGGFAPWKDEGFALSGSTGNPVLAGSGSLCVGAPSSLRVSNAKPVSRCILISGNNASYTPFHGGTLVPAPQQVIRGFGTNAHGSVVIEDIWPPNGLASGSTRYFQAWIQDPAAPQGWSATNAVSGVAP